jgi:hypothetical protein
MGLSKIFPNEVLGDSFELATAVTLEFEEYEK